MVEEMAELASAGAGALVAAMATDGWEAARAGFVRLFRRGELAERAALEAQLASGAELVGQAEDTEAARRSLVAPWEFQLAALVRRHPEAAAEVRAWVAAERSARPQWTAVQNVDVRDSGRANAVVNGNIVIHEAGPGGS
ncbi:hypothetical protein [Streptomyces sp. NPDC049585]|uniref:hypothetical protein n=1 Tax=Streptomyces sp. NPDC049585 TaxID=3155154 RepID=UPI00343725D6